MTTTEEYTVLLIEDDPSFASSVRALLDESNLATFRLDVATTLQGGREALDRPGGYDVVLLDLSLPDAAAGLEPLRDLVALQTRTPIVVLTDATDAGGDIEAVGIGAQDYLHKGIMTMGSLSRAILHAIERNRQQVQLQQANAELAAMFHSSAVGLARLDLGGRFLEINDAFADLLALAPEDTGSVVGRPLADFLDDVPERPARRETDLLLDVDRDRLQLEIPLRTTTGRAVWVNISTSVVRSEDGTPLFHVAQVIDISQRMLAENRLRITLDTLNEGVAVVTDEGAFATWNPAMTRILGFDPAGERDPLGLFVRRLVDAEGGPILAPRDPVSRALYDSIETTNEVFGFVRPNGEHRWVSITTRRVPDEAGVRVVMTVADVTDAHHVQADLRRRALHDGLTGLPNRTLLLEHLGRALARSHRSDDQVAVLFIDLDRFKPVNDTYGHATGDELLKVMAERVTESARSSDVVARSNDLVARFGGDEFVVLLDGLSHPDDAIAVAHRLIERLSEPVQLDVGTVEVGASVGIALAQHAAVTPEEMLAQADMALYQSKRDGRGRATLRTLPGP